MITLPQCSDYTTAITVSNLVKAHKLAGGHPEMYRDRPVHYAGGFCIVYPYFTNNSKYAVRCWHAYLDGAKERTKIISESLKKLNLPYFVGFEYIDGGIVTALGPQPIVVMDWVDAHQLKSYLSDNLHNPEKLNNLAANFAKMVKCLHDNKLSHGDLQHGNIMVKDNGDLVLVDYDSMYVPELDGWSDEINGLAGYQHPARFENKKLSPKADYFSELVIYTSIKALANKPSLWNDLKMEDTDTLLFDADDINSKGSTPIFSTISEISQCSHLVSAIKKALECSSIEELQPLEEANRSLADVLGEKWKDNGYKPSSPYSQSDVESVVKKW